MNGKLFVNGSRLRALFAFVLAGAIAPLAYSAAVTIEWDANQEPHVVGYNVYVGTQSRVYNTMLDSGNATTNRVSSLQPGSTYYFAVTAYAQDRSESPFSEEVSYTVPFTATNNTPIVLSLRRSAADARVTVSFAAQSNQLYLVQASSNLLAWQTV